VQHDASYPREEPGAGNLHARIREGESRMAELLDHRPVIDAFMFEGVEKHDAAGAHCQLRCFQPTGYLLGRPIRFEFPRHCLP
jgi:hypothetical protein